jgi:quercetin dioxygenase-like cupin family protein
MIKRRVPAVVLVAIGIALGTMTVANADGGSGFSSTPIGRGQATSTHGLAIQQGTDVVTVQNTITPGGFSGWHSHPGVVILVLQAGQLTVFTERIAGGPCQSATYTAGQVFFELPQNMQNTVNTGSVDAVVAVTFTNVPHGGSVRIDQPNPGDCP